MKNYIALMGLLLISTSCSNDMKSTLGLKKHAPDEFTVISNPALSVPPDFALSNPGEDKKFLEFAQPSEAINEKLSKEEQDFIQKLGKNQNDGNIAKQIDAEYRSEQNKRNSKGAIRKTISKWNPESQPVIEPSAEKERIKNNLEKNIPLNEGVVQEKKSKSTLDNILN